MLTKKQIEEIREHLSKAQNPIFFFDNDPDGFCSFLLLQRYIERGRGVPIRSFPGLDKDYLRKVQEFKSDYIFILDKPVVSEEFFREVEKINIPIVWIDHHAIEKELIPHFVFYYNPLFNRTKKNEPVTALCYQIANKKDNLWIAMVGCVADQFIPKFYNSFRKKYPDLAVSSNSPPDIYYRSQIGRIARLLDFGLKDRTTNVMNMIRFMIKVKTPYEVLEENNKNYTMHKRFRQIEIKYRDLLKKASSIGRNKDKMLFFQYGGDLSISGNLSNELYYLFPEKIIVVAYIKGAKANVSMRGKKVREIIIEALKGFENASGGGHENAVGGQLNIDDLEKFRENLRKLIQ